MSITARFLMGLLAFLAGIAATAGIVWKQSGLDWSAPPPMVWRAGDLEVTQGAALKGADSLLVTFEQGSGRIVLKVPSMPFRAEDAGIARILMDPLPEQVKGGMFWRASDHRQIQSMPLSTTGTRVTADLLRHPAWQGTITEFGIVFLGPATEALTLNGLHLERPSFSGRLLAYFAALAAPDTWTQRTINFLGFPPAIRDASPPLLAGSVVLFALIILSPLLLMHRARPAVPAMALGVFVAAWLLLDTRWQWILLHNATEARATWIAVPRGMKDLGSHDSRLRQFAMDIKRDVLPPSPQRIFIVHDSEGHNIARLRLQYHLLPHNIHNFWRKPKPQFVREGDYIILLGAVPGVTYRPSETALRLDDGKSIPAQAVHRSMSASVFRVLPPGGKEVTP